MKREKIFLHCLRGLVDFEDRFDTVDPQHAAWVCERLAWHKILPLASALNHPGKPKCAEVEKAFRHVFFNNAIRAQLYEKQVSRLFQMLKEASVNFIPYKGPFWFQQIYPDYTWRHIGDIDLMMDREDARKVSMILQDAGYAPDVVGVSVDEDFQLRGELTFFQPSQKELFPVQLHWAPLPSPRFMRKKFMTADLFKVGAVPMDWKGIEFMIPRPEIQFFYHILHATCQHQFLRFSHLLTPIHFLTKFPDLDWDFFQELTKTWNSHIPVYYGLKFIAAFYQLPEGARLILHNTRPPFKSRFAAAFLHPRAITGATRKRGRIRRELFRAAMSW